jgi:hypothetical protein
MARTWTPEQKARQADLIRSWKPWEKSTGPTSPAGKATASQNRQFSLEQAEAELLAAKAKVRRLHGGKEPLPDWLKAVIR